MSPVLNQFQSLLNDHAAARSSDRTKKTKVVVSTPADFQRVRLMSILRLKKQKAKKRSQHLTSPYLTPSTSASLYDATTDYGSVVSFGQSIDDGAEVLEREFKKNPKPTTQNKRQFAEDMGVDLAGINVCLHNLQVTMPTLLITRRTGSRIDVSIRSKKRNRKPNFEIDAEGPKEKESLRMWRRPYWQSSLGLGDLQDIPQSRRHSFETGGSLRRPSSSIRSPDIASRKLEDEILRQIRTARLLDEIDLENIDVNQENQISERIAEAFRKRQIGKTAGLTEQEQLQYEYGGPLTPSPADSPMMRSYQHTPSRLRGESPAVRGSEALNFSTKIRGEHEKHSNVRFSCTHTTICLCRLRSSR